MLTIHREQQPDRLIRMGHAPVVLEPEHGPESPQLSMAIISEPPPEPEKNKRGRPKKMSEENKLGHEAGVNTIKQEDPGKQGPIGSDTSEKRPPASDDVALGKEERNNG